MMNQYEKLHALVELHNAQYRVVSHNSEGECFAVSNLRGSTLTQSAKAIVAMVKLSKKDKKYFLVVLGADKRVDFGKLKSYARGTFAGFAPRDRAYELTGCEMGAVPPFSLDGNLPVIVDGDFVSKNREGEIAFNAACLEKSMFLGMSDYLRLASPEVVDVSQ